MEGSYRVYDSQGEVGQVQVIQQGLYYRFICRAKLPERRFLHLWAVCPEHRLDLGLLIPEQGEYHLSVKRPMKYFSGMHYRFSLEENTQASQWQIDEHTPFLHIKELKHSKLVFVGGNAAAVIKMQDTD